jgi:hypothetical protein
MAGKKRTEERIEELVEVKTVTETAMTPQSVSVQLAAPGVVHTHDEAFWGMIRDSTAAISFNRLIEFVDRAMCDPESPEFRDVRREARGHALPFPHVDAYNLLKVATEVFLMKNCGVTSSPLLEAKKEVNKDPSPGAQEDLLAAERFERRMDEDEKLRLEPDEKNETDRQIREEYFRKYATHDGMIPYLDIIRMKLGDVAVRDREALGYKCYGILREKLVNPCMIELIWSYWHEEGMLVQAVNAITMRFQNRKGPASRDPLADFDLDALRPINNLLWGFVQDEQHRLTVLRRAYEYDHCYGISLHGRAIPAMRTADSRSKFLEAFHHLLHLCCEFYKQLDDMTVRANGFKVLNGLREVHLLLTQGGGNQYGDLPWTARQEMLMMQWLLARPEMREFIPGRIMVAYPEPWMDRVDALKSLQGWTDTSVLHFRELGMYGERILLGIRYGAWAQIMMPEAAANWARFWRPELEGYVHAYRAATGVDLTNRDALDNTAPSVHLRRRLAAQLRGV